MCLRRKKEKKDSLIQKASSIEIPVHKWNHVQVPAGKIPAVKQHPGEKSEVELITSLEKSQQMLICHPTAVKGMELLLGWVSN